MDSVGATGLAAPAELNNEQPLRHYQPPGDPWTRSTVEHQVGGAEAPATPTAGRGRLLASKHHRRRAVGSADPGRRSPVRVRKDGIAAAVAVLHSLRAAVEADVGMRPASATLVRRVSDIVTPRSAMSRPVERIRRILAVPGIHVL